MSSATTSTFSRGIKAYVYLVACLGALAVGASAHDLVTNSYQWRSQWLSLVVLTVVSGLLPVKLPTINVSISVSETFVIAGTLLFGRSGGTLLVLLDAFFISMRLFWSRGLKWQQVVFNLAAPPLSIWIAARVVNIQPLFGAQNFSFDTYFVGTLAGFTTLYFLCNSWLITFALALQQRLKATAIWRKHFWELLVNYVAGGSIAALLVYNTRTVQWETVVAIVPLLIVLFFTYQWANKRVEAEREKVAELNRVFLSTVEALALAIDAKDQVTHGHIRRVQRYTMALADSLGVKDASQLDALRAAALLHDTGKLAVPEYILNKPGPLTASEFERMKLHATVGADILKSINFPYPVEPIVRHHHENWDGTGYPEGLKGQDIPLGARILSVVDCYDALTSDRPYRPRYSRKHSEQVLKERRGAMYDPWVVDGFLNILDTLEKLDESVGDHHAEGGRLITGLAPSQFEVISATTAEDREFNELRRELSKAVSFSAATDAMFRHVKRVIPAANLTLYLPKPESNELVPVATTGVGTSTVDGLRIPLGDRISGWAAAHRQVVVNSNAALDLGPVARTLTTPLRFALAVPVLSGPGAALAVLTCYGSEPFSNDHRRMLESAATLFAPSLLTPGDERQLTVGDVSAKKDSDSRVH